MQLADIRTGMRDASHFQNRPVPQQLVLEMLDDAVWAPNHGLREPWRFVYVDNGSGDAMQNLQEPAPAYLIVVMKEDPNPHKRDEDFAAVFCLIQNFRLLAREKKLGVRRTMHEWIYDQKRSRLFGVREKECIAAVLDLGYFDQMQEASFTPLIELKFELL
ncbi:nitroreductase family protein [Paenibacillus sepulcri]|uniref:Nitroreductase family protein n=1 Tax=Paenibacillus sepulcri TaxID=359917 RepID=A0ABS7CAY2_9BACL|nr:nitroreductase family protein [Paenibacillus sepulcri]